MLHRMGRTSTATYHWRQSRRCFTNYWSDKSWQLQVFGHIYAKGNFKSSVEFVNKYFKMPSTITLFYLCLKFTVSKNFSWHWNFFTNFFSTLETFLPKFGKLKLQYVKTYTFVVNYIKFYPKFEFWRLFDVVTIRNGVFCAFLAFQVQRGGFDWTLTYRWLPPPSERFQNPIMDMTLPVPSPTMSGGVFAIDKKYFLDLGAYDEGMELFGGENLEMSFRVRVFFSISKILRRFAFTTVICLTAA